MRFTIFDALGTLLSSGEAVIDPAAAATASAIAASGVRTVVPAGGVYSAIYSANSNQATYICQSSLLLAAVTSPFGWQPDVAGTIAAVSIISCGSNASGNHTVRLLKNGALLGTPQVFGAANAQGVTGGAITSASFPFAAGDTITATISNSSSGSFQANLYLTVLLAAS